MYIFTTQMIPQIYDKLHTSTPIEMLHLEREVFRYHYLSQSQCSYVLTMDDDKQFNVTLVRQELHNTFSLSFALSCSHFYMHVRVIIPQLSLSLPHIESHGGGRFHAGRH